MRILPSLVVTLLRQISPIKHTNTFEKQVKCFLKIQFMSFLPNKDYTAPCINVNAYTEDIILRLYFSATWKSKLKGMNRYSYFWCFATSEHHLQLPTNNISRWLHLERLMEPGDGLSYLLMEMQSLMRFLYPWSSSCCLVPGVFTWI